MTQPPTTFLLIRHAAPERGADRLNARERGVHLSPEGRRQAEELADRLAAQSTPPIRAVYASPLERTVETAEPLARRLGLAVQTCEPVLEVAFGEWTGRTFADLGTDERWVRWNAFRSGSRAPGGEMTIEIQARVVAEMLRLRDRHPGETIALVSHGDVIRGALAYWLGVAIDLFLRIEVGYASVSAIALGGEGVRVLCMNTRGDFRPG